MIFALIGPPGSGKGTQGQFLSQKLLLPHLSTGDMLRKMVDSGAEEGKLANEYMNNGKLVPSELVNKIVKKCLSLAEYEKGCLLDGYPRNIEQAKFLEKIRHDIKILYFAADDQIIIKRILGRYNCKNCGKIYNKYYFKPKQDGICDICGSSSFSYRNDDDEASVKRRLTEYKRETYPLVDYYQKGGHLFKIDANKTTQEVEAELNSLLLSDAMNLKAHSL